MAAHQKLKQWRERANLTQAEAAKRAKVWQSRWSEIEAGKRPPSIAQAAGIERATGGAVRMVDWLPKRARPIAPDDTGEHPAVEIKHAG